MRGTIKGIAFAVAMLAAACAVGPETTWVGMGLCVLVMVPAGLLVMRLEHLDKVDARRRNRAKRKALQEQQLL